MTPVHRFNFALLILIGCAMVTVAQTTPTDVKQFSKDGLTFSYPNGWTMEDVSNPDAQQFNFGRSDSEAQMRLFVYRTHLTTPERAAEARKVLVDPYVNSTFRQFEQMAAKPTKAPATIDVGTAKSEGVRINATLDGEPGAAEIHWAVVGQRLVVLTILGSDRSLKKAAPAWDAIRKSIAIEEPKPAPVKTPTPQ